MGFQGNPRTGKTLLMTRFFIKLIVLALSQGYIIGKDRFYYANWHFLKEYERLVTHITPQDLLKIRLNTLFSGVVGLDELWAWAMSRGSGLNINNKLLGMSSFQSGKSGYDVLWSAQLSSAVDKWFRLLTDYFFVSLTPTENAFRYAYVSSTRVSRFKFAKSRAMIYYPYFNTQERILPLEGKMEDYKNDKWSKSNNINEDDAIKTYQEEKLSAEDSGLIDTIKRQLKKEILQEVVEQLRKDLDISPSLESSQTKSKKNSEEIQRDSRPKIEVAQQLQTISIGDIPNT